jgi:hypothetical protein
VPSAPSATTDGTETAREPRGRGRTDEFLGEGEAAAGPARGGRVHPQRGPRQVVRSRHQGTPLAKDVWMLGIGPALTIDGLTGTAGD